MQYLRVEVDEGRAYTYTYDGSPPLKRGELVLLPSNMVKDREFVGKVLREIPQPDTEIPLKRVLRRALSAEDEDLL